MKELSILGSTGSIGTQTIDVIQNMSDKFSVKYLSTYQNIELIIKQAKILKPSAICIVDSTKLKDLNSSLSGIEILHGRNGLLELSSRSDIDLVVNGLVGAPGMEPTVNAIKAGVDVALSNKESLVMAGEYINALLSKHNVKLFPVDSEHSAIWQCLVGEKLDQVKRLILTGSGGPFRELSKTKFNEITKSQALQHPNWSMGNKITIDSATMMNKGLEVIEARWLFNFGPDEIDIVVHPQSVIHSMVEFIDGSVKAQLGLPDMKIPIQYAITYPNHLKTDWESLNLVDIGKLTFEAPDLEKFRCIKLAYDALEAGGSNSIALNLANDLVVYKFLNDKIKFVDIPALIESAIDSHPIIKHPNLDDIKELTKWTNQFFEGKLN